MIKRIIRFSAENKYLVLSLYVIAILIAVWVMKRTPLDAIPDQSDTQVIIYSRWDRSPDIIEDQVTYPITTALLGAPKVKAIRGYSDFGFSYVYVIFEDGTDLYWARSRVLEYLSKITPQLPRDVQVELGPDATSVGWVFQYALVDDTGQHSSDELRSYQDWFLRYQVQSVPGVAEVATVGGQVRQYQISVNPNALAAYKLPLDTVIQAVRHGNWKAIRLAPGTYHFRYVADGDQWLNDPAADGYEPSGLGQDNSVLVFPFEVREILEPSQAQGNWLDEVEPPSEGEWDDCGNFHTLSSQPHSSTYHGRSRRFWHSACLGDFRNKSRGE